nr:PAS domain S-box protein [Bacteroidota bacterium]
MNGDIFLGLVHNTAMLLSLVVLFSVFRLDKSGGSYMLEILIGLIIGAFGIALMMTPWTFSEGIIFDTRSILLSMTGLFFGFIPTIISVLMTGVLRIYQGGDGVFMGIAVILTSSTLGLLWRYHLKIKSRIPRWQELYAFGLLVHVAMLGCGFLLPREISLDVLSRISLPVMLIYPFGTVMLGMMLIYQQRRGMSDSVLRESEQKFREVFNSTNEAIFIDDALTGNLIDCNDRTVELYGYDHKEEILQGNIGDLSANIEPYTEKMAQHHIRLAINEGTQTFEWLARKKSGENFWVEVSLKKTTIGGENRVLAVVRDITDRKLAEDTLLRSQERARQQRNAIARIAVNKLISIGNMTGSFHFLTTEIAAALNVGRAGIWLFSDDKSELLSVSLFDSKSKKHIEGSSLKSGDYPHYFEAIKNESRINADDAQNDWRTCEFSEGYLVPLGITSMLDAGIHVEGELMGVVCFEHTGEKRTWQPDEESFVSTVAAMVAQIIANNKRRLIQEALRDSEEKYRTIFENVHDIFYQTDLKGYVLEISPSIKHFSEFNREEIIGTHVENLYYDPNDRDMLLNALKKDGELRDYEIRLKTKSGEIRYVSINARLISDADGSPNHIDGSLRDITERKKAEEALSNSEDRYRNFISQTSEGVYRFELDKPMPLELPVEEQIDFMYDHMFIAECNQAFIKMYGIENMNEIIGKSQKELHGGNQNPANRAALRQFIQSGYRTENIETMEPDVNGQLRYYSNSAVGIIENGHLVRSWGTQTDITDKKQMLEDLMNALEKARESDRLKSAFLANMSHEIRTPMNGIMGFAELLKEPDLTGEEQKKYISVIENSGERLLNIINDLIDISKIEAGQIEVTYSQTNIYGQFDYIYNFFKPAAEKKGLQFSINNRLTVNEAIINTDRQKLYAILSNLVKNAIKYTNEGSVEIGCKIADVETHGDASQLQFYVKDTGIGIYRNRQEAIFDRFVQADIEDKKAMEGAGLGLSITKAYVEMLGGKIWVESNPDGYRGEEGSAFYFTIPYIAKTSEKKVMDTIATGEDEKTLAKQLKILLAEDEETSNLLITIMLSKISCEILHAKTGNDAVELCRIHPDLDLVLMDIKMPEMDGYEATRQIRQFNKDLIIFAQTAYGQTGDRAKAIKAGCNDYISKPIKKDKLMALIQKYFNK